MGFITDLINSPATETILGGRGRGAENYGIEVAQPSGPSDDTITLSIINLNSTSGAHFLRVR